MSSIIRAARTIRRFVCLPLFARNNAPVTLNLFAADAILRGMVTDPPVAWPSPERSSNSSPSSRTKPGAPGLDVQG